MNEPKFAEGSYEGKMVSWGRNRAAGGKGNFQFWFKVRLISVAYDPENAAEGFAELPPEEQVMRTVYMPFTEKNLDIQLNNLKRLGYDRPNFKGLDPGPDGFDFKNQVVQLYCSHQEFPKGSGRLRESWGLARPPIATLSEEESDAMDSLFGLAIRAKFGSEAKEVYDLGNPKEIPF